MRRIGVGVLAVAVVLVMTAPASASTTLLKRSVSAKSAKQVRCHSKLRTGKGVVRRNVRIGRPSLVRADLLARRGDWDVAIFQARDRRLVGASSGFRSREVAEGFADAGKLIVQACRNNRRTSRRARISVRSIALPQKTGKKRTVASLVSVSTPTRAAKNRLLSLGLDVTEHGDQGHLDVVLHSAADAAKLRGAGFTYRTEIADLALQSFRNRQANMRYRAKVKKSALPSGRDEYRRLADFEADMKALVRARPDLAKPIVLPNRSLEGRLIHGVEITQNVNAPDGKPVFFQMGVHHAREWPSAEMPMEFATELVRSYGKDARITNLVNRTRTIVVPVINPDGYNLSREEEMTTQPLGSADPYGAALSNLLLDPTGIYQTDGPLGTNAPLVNQVVTNPGHTAAILADAQLGNFAYKRRNCRIEQNKRPAPGACALSENRTLGTDPNRNYGGFWGGPGASADPGVDTFRGSAPFSEPEVQNVRRVVSTRQVTTLITNHTFSNLVLRPPGVAAEGKSPDEVVYKALGDAMGKANGYASQYGYELYDTTGTTEDWSYYASGGLGFTFEIGPNEFHPPYEQVVAEYEGNPSTPVDREPFGRDKAGGNREAYLLAMESTANSARHAVLTGNAPAGATLEVTRAGTSLTSPVIREDDTLAPPITINDVMRSSTRVPASGRFEWHINPSTRPYAKKDRRQYEVGTTPTSRQNVSGGPATERIPITIGPNDKGLKAVIDVSDTSDYDTYLFNVAGQQVSSGSNGFLGEDEKLAVTGLPPGQYELEVRNFAAAEPWTGTIEKFAAVGTIGSPAQAETWLLTCRSASGKTLGKRDVSAERGQRVNLRNVCGSTSSTLLSATSRGKLKVGLRARRPRSLGSLLRRGMKVRVSCARSCVTLLRLRRGKTTIAAKRVRLRGGRSKVVTLKVGRKAARKLRKAKSARLTLSATGRALTGPREVRRAAVSFRVRR